MSTTSKNDFMSMMEKWFDKVPALPKNAREALVKVMPWIALIFGILGILGAVGGLGLLSVSSPFAMMGGAEGVSSYGTGFLAALIWLGSSVLLLAAFPGMKAHKHAGWNLLFWSEALNLVGAVVSVSSLVSGLIGALIGFYLLFQIKSYYK